MNSLVATFERKLECSNDEAFWRVVELFFIPVVMGGVIAVVAFFFPYQSSYTQEFPVLPGDHVQASKILDGEVLVDREQFLELAKGNQTFIAVGDSDIRYMVKEDGVSYLYVQSAGHDGMRYYVGNHEIQDNVVVRELQRDMASMLALFIASPIIVLVMLFELARMKTFKRHGHLGNYTHKSVFD